MDETRFDTAACNRCGVKLRIRPVQRSEARILRRSKDDKGYCVNCAVHDWVRNTYPVNLILARSGPKGLALPHLQRQFEEIMRAGFSDAAPDEINWARIIDNWDLPFPTKVKRRSENPMNEADIEKLLRHERDKGIWGI